MRGVESVHFYMIILNDIIGNDSNNDNRIMLITGWKVNIEIKTPIATICSIFHNSFLLNVVVASNQCSILFNNICRTQYDVQCLLLLTVPSIFAVLIILLIYLLLVSYVITKHTRLVASLMST